MVGLCFAQGLAYALRLPFVPVNHIEAHMFSPFIDEGSADAAPEGPFVSLTVSGGHTLLSVIESDLSYEVIGRTLDDAAGEAFDKTGKMLGLDYPAGPVIDRLAKGGDPLFHEFPRAMTSRSQTSKNYRGNFDFSFSGLKTSVRYFIRDHPALLEDGRQLRDLCASVQAAIVDVLVGKTIQAARRLGVRCVTASGGVTCNRELRRRLAAACAARGLKLRLAEPRFCTDNAGMIGVLAERKLLRGEAGADLDEEIAPAWTLGEAPAIRN